MQIRQRRYNGVDLVDVRAWYPDPEGEGLKPGKGLAIRLEQFPELEKAVRTAKKALAQAPKAFGAGR